MDAQGEDEEEEEVGAWAAFVAPRYHIVLDHNALGLAAAGVAVRGAETGRARERPGAAIAAALWMQRLKK